MSDRDQKAVGASRRNSVDRVAHDYEIEHEAEARNLFKTFDGRLEAAEKRIDRVLARLGVE